MKPITEWDTPTLRACLTTPHLFDAIELGDIISELLRRERERCLTACYGWDVTSILYRDEEIAAAEWARRMCDTAIKELK